MFSLIHPYTADISACQTLRDSESQCVWRQPPSSLIAFLFLLVCFVGLLFSICKKSVREKAKASGLFYNKIRNYSVIELI